jgi:hypothetical protein
MHIPTRGLVRYAAIAFATVAALAVASPAAATIRGPQTTAVSCDGTTIKSGVSVVHRLTGTFSIRQDAATQSSSTKSWAVSANGNSLSVKTVSTGGTVSWTSVLPSTYTVKALRSTNKNCNGILPGAGNYNWTYTVTYVG